MRHPRWQEITMTRKDQPTAISDAPDVGLPGTACHISQEKPDLWEAFQRLGEQVTRAGPLESQTRRLVHLAFAIAAGSEGATHSHARRALAEGITPAQLDHVALLAITGLGWSQAIKGLTWVRDVTQGEKSPARGPLLDP
jgi:alkylhydroperoxidase/carboxymuconolactone decarboxylase family protein YurZ